jgi:hypothetical protein
MNVAIDRLLRLPKQLSVDETCLAGGQGQGRLPALPFGGASVAVSEPDAALRAQAGRARGAQAAHFAFCPTTWKTPKPRTGIWTSLLRETYCMVSSVVASLVPRGAGSGACVAGEGL